jgi:predicted ATPase
MRRWRRPRTGHQVVVLIGGEAGVGKSRLVNEFSTRARVGGALVLTGGCFDLSAGGLPYGPIVEALRRLDRTLDAVARAQITGPAQSELARLLSVGDATQRWLGDAPGTGSAQAQTFELLLEFLGRLSASAPVVVVVEDVHWADRTTLDLLAFLLRNLFEERVLMVVTYRGEELQGRHSVRAFLAELDRTRRTERMELQGFSAEDWRSCWATSPVPRCLPRWSTASSPARVETRSLPRSCSRRAWGKGKRRSLRGSATSSWRGWRHAHRTPRRSSG